MFSIIQIYKSCDKVGAKMIINFIKINIVRFTKCHQFKNKYKNFNKFLFLEVFYRLITYKKFLFNFCRSSAF